MERRFAPVALILISSVLGACSRDATNEEVERQLRALPGFAEGQTRSCWLVSATDDPRACADELRASGVAADTQLRPCARARYDGLGRLHRASDNRTQVTWYLMIEALPRPAEYPSCDFLWDDGERLAATPPSASWTSWFRRADDGSWALIDDPELWLATPAAEPPRPGPLPPPDPALGCWREPMAPGGHRTHCFQTGRVYTLQYDGTIALTGRPLAFRGVWQRTASGLRVTYHDHVMGREVQWDYGVSMEGDTMTLTLGGEPSTLTRASE